MRNTVTFLLILAFAQVSFGQPTPDTLWTRTYGGSSSDFAYSVQQTSDGGYVVTGYTYSFGAGSSDFYLVKTNSSGDTLWTRTYGGGNDDWASFVQQTDDGGYIVAGMTNSFGAGQRDFYVVKTNSQGDTLWTRTYGGSNDDWASSAQQTDDGGYILAGSSFSFGAGPSDFYLVKTNSQGDTLWTRTYGGSGPDFAYSVQQTADGGFIVAGSTLSFGAGYNDFYVVKTNSQGDTLWTRVYGGSDDDFANSVQQTADGGYIVAGSTYPFGADETDFYVVKTNSQGDTLWTRTYGGSNADDAYSVLQATDGGYVVAGRTLSFGAGNNNFYVVRTNSQGDTLWTRTYGGNSDDFAYSVQQTADGGYVVAGATYSFGAGEWDFYVVKTGPDNFAQLSGSLSGTIGPGTYQIVGDISVQGSNTLTLLPGTVFTFDSLYEFHINGTLLAEGTESDSIVFTTDTTANPTRWRGLRFDGSGSSSSRLTYCVIENGHRTGGQPNNYGGGVYCTSSSPTFTHCVIRNNIAEEGGGVYCTSSLAVFTNCTISGNSATILGGGGFCDNSSPTFTSCVFDNNEANNGGGVSCYSSSGSFTNCTVSGNSAGTNGGGVLDYDASTTFTNCIFTDNSAGQSGGGLKIGYSSPTFTRCTISENRAGDDGGGVSCGLSSPTFNNTIIAFSSNQGIWFDRSAESQFKYCNIYGNSGGDITFPWDDPSNGPAGIGELVTTNANDDSCDVSFNIYLNPMFVDTAASDYHLLAGSPCIDAGDPALLPDPDHTVVEIGAFYFPQQPITFFVSPDSLDFGTVLYRADSTLAFWIHNPTQNMLQVAGIRAMDTLIFHANPTAVQIPPMDSVEIELTFTPRRNISYLDSVQISIAMLDEAQTVVVEGMGYYDCHVLDGSVSGVLSMDCNPYHVASAVTIQDGDVLTIEAGVEIIFDCHCQFVVNGLLQAIGTEQDSIRFTCDAAFNPDHWGGLRFVSAHDSCRLEYCVIEKSRAEGAYPNNNGGGIYCESSSPAFAHCGIRDNWAEEGGGGVHCRAQSSATFTHCTFCGNSSDGNGGGVYCSGSSPNLADCVVSDNSTSTDGGGMHCSSSSPTLTNCTISDNSAGNYGGGIDLYDYSSRPTFTHCAISGNMAISYGGGMRCGGASPSLDGCTISGNTGSQGGGMFFGSSSSSLMHCVINDNTADYAGGVFCSFSSDTFTNCTITGNSVENDGGGVYCQNASPTFNSTIISFSNGDGIYFRNSSASVFQYCDIFGNSDGNITFRDDDPSHGPPGIGELVTMNANDDSCDTYLNIFLDPMFADTAANNYHLLTGSPCIDAGDPDLPLDPDGTVADIGVFSFQGQAPLAFDLLSPANGDTVDTLDVTLEWAASSDPDPGDSIVFYRVYVALDSAFTSELDSETVSATELVWSDLEAEQIYWWRVKAFDTQGFGTFSNQIWNFYARASAISNGSVSLPREYALHQNYPNPFNPTTVIRYDVPMAEPVRLAIFNLLGQQMATLFDGRQLAGSYAIQWDAADWPSGVYLCRMEAAGFVQTRKMLLVK